MVVSAHDVSLDGRDHAVHLYERAVELVDSVSGHIDAAEEPASGHIDAAEEPPVGEPLGMKLAADFAAERASPGRARRLTLGALAEWGCGPGLLRDAAVVVSELATNAVLHAVSSFSLAVTLEDSLLRIAVHDARPLSATARGCGMSPQPTHGLGLVEALSLRWGTEGTTRGKAVWAELRASNASNVSYTSQASRPA